MRVGHRAALPLPEPEPPPVGEGGYDPGEHTVAEVLEYVADHPDQAENIREAEENGKARTTLLDAL